MGLSFPQLHVAPPLLLFQITTAGLWASFKQLLFLWKQSYCYQGVVWGLHWFRSSGPQRESHGGGGGGMWLQDLLNDFRFTSCHQTCLLGTEGRYPTAERGRRGKKAVTQNQYADPTDKCPHRENLISWDFSPRKTIRYFPLKTGKIKKKIYYITNK